MRRLVSAALFATAVVFHPFLIEPFESPKAAVVRTIGLAILLAALAGRAWRGERWTVLDRVAVGWLAVEAITTVFARAPLLSFFGEQHQHEGLFTSLGLAGLFLGARLSCRDPRSIEAWIDVWLLGAAVAAAYALLQAARLDPAPWLDTAVMAGGTMRPFGTLGHPNLLGAITAPAAVVALDRGLGDARRRLWYLIGAALFGAATLVTLSRAAWLGLVAGLVVALVLRGSGGLRVSRRTLLLAAGSLAVLAIAGTLSGWGVLVIGRLRELVAGGGSASSRLEIWRIAIAAWRDRPFLGQGPDMFGLVFPRFQTAAMWNLEWGRVADHAHSIYLHALATRGLLGVLAGGAGVAGLSLGLVAALRSGAVLRAPVAALAGALVAVAVTGGFGALGICGAALVAVLAGSVSALAAAAGGDGVAAAVPERGPRSSGASGRGGKRARGSRAAVVAGSLAALLVLAWSVNELLMSVQVKRAQRWLVRSAVPADRPAQLEAAMVADASERVLGRVSFDDWAPRTLAETIFRWSLGWPEPQPLLVQAASAAREAIRRVPLRSLDHLRLAEVLAARTALGDPASREACEEAFRRAAELAPVDAFVLVEWARARLAFGDAPGALPIARRVATLYPRSGIALEALAESYLANGNESAAREALARARSAEWYGDADGIRRADELARRLVP